MEATVAFKRQVVESNMEGTAELGGDVRAATGTHFSFPYQELVR